MAERKSAVEAHDADVPALAGFTNTYRYYVLIVLTAVYMVNVIDRQILTILIEPIKREMGLSDTQLGFLTGISFAIFYATMGIPIAAWADRGNRRNIIAVTLALFAGMTVMSGLVKNYTQLLLARILIAVGDAGTLPSSNSIITDMFPPGKRAAALAIFFMGINLGVLVGFLTGGWISQFYGWRTAFFIVGFPGLLLVLLVYLTVKEPIRGQSDGLTKQAAADTPPFMEVLRMMWAQRSFRHIMTAVAITSIGSYAMIMWLPSFLLRSHHMTLGEVGTTLAFMIGVVGGAGTYLSGQCADFFGKRDARWNVWVVAIANALSFPLCIAMYLAETKLLFLALLIYPAFAYSFFMAPSVAMAQSLVVPRMRARAAAIFFLILTMVGQSIGPQLTGLLSDFYRAKAGEESLRYALLTMSVFWLWSSFHYLLAARTLRQDLEHVRRQVLNN